MRARAIVMASAVVVLWMPGAAGAQPAQRLSDQDVRRLIDQVEQERDQFEDKLDGQFKNAILRGPRGEVNVKQYLRDFQEKVGKLQDRFKKDNSASTEARAVLEQATEIDDYIRRQPPGMKGTSEWDRLSVDLGRLAEAYRTSFPLPPDAAVRRINDAEAASTAEAVARSADRLKGPIGSDKALEKPDRELAKKRLDDIRKLANTVRSRASDSQPATSEARQVVDLGFQLRGDIEGRALSPKSLAAWDTLRVNLEKLEQAYGLAPPPRRP